VHVSVVVLVRLPFGPMAKTAVAFTGVAEPARFSTRIVIGAVNTVTPEESTEDV
jgi:hypothetical protein